MRTLIVLSALAFALPQVVLGACTKVVTISINYQSKAGTSGVMEYSDV